MASRHRILVEGRDDQNVIRNLLREHGIAAKILEPPSRRSILDAIAIERTEGIEVLLEDLVTELRQSDQECVGIVVDANTDLAARWQAVGARLERAGAVDVPAEPDPSGTVLTIRQRERELKVGVWLMPDNQLSGMLEDFIVSLAPEGDELLDCAQQCIDGLPHRPFGDAESKALIHTWLAWQEEPGKPLGLAITIHYLDTDSPYALNFVAWVQRLFGV